MPITSTISQIDDKVADFVKTLKIVNSKIQKEFLRLISAGQATPEAIQLLFSDYPSIQKQFISQYSAVLGFQRQLASEFGFQMKLGEKAEALFLRMQEISRRELEVTRLTIQNSLSRIAVRSEIDGLGRKQILNELRTTFSGTERRLEVEAFDGMRITNNAVKKESFKNAGITKYYYSGPDDDRTRIVCQETLADPKQQTGWTLEEVDASQTPFGVCGGWNCRHEWLPYKTGE